MKAVKASGIFAGVKTAALATHVQAEAGGNAGTGSCELSLDSWEAPLVFEVTAVAEPGGSAVYQGTTPSADGSQEVIAIRVEANASAAGDSGGIRRVEVTRATKGSAPDSVLELRGDDN